jgi:hypothetical protein
VTSTDNSCVEESEVKDALKRMKRGKVMGPNGIPIEVWRSLGDVTIVWLTKLFNLIFRSNRMSDEWRRSILVPIFKNKGDVQSCTNYRGIKLMKPYNIGSKRKTCIWFLLTWRRPMTKCLGMSCGGLCRRTKSHQSTLPSLRICR